MRSHRAIDKANLVIAVLKVVAHGRPARREGLGVEWTDDERLPAGAIGRGATPEEAHSENNNNKDFLNQRKESASEKKKLKEILVVVKI